MKKTIMRLIGTVLCCIILSWAAWHGETKHDGSLEGYVNIVSCPAGCYTQSTGSGGYHCGLDNGMTENTYYYYIQGYKTIDGVYHQGKYWVQDEYDDNSPKYGLLINLVNTDDK